MMAIWLADVLRAEGLQVLETPGWKRRQTRAGFNPVGLVVHNTVTGPSVPNTQVRQLLIDGHGKLTGPLSQLGLERDGTFAVIAAGRCNHNGYGLWGNDSFGIEAYNDGQGEPWPAVQLDAYHRGCAAICRRMGWDASRIKGHKETDPKRKIDPAGIEMGKFRLAVTRHLRPPTPPQKDDDDMAAGSLIKTPTAPEWWLSDGFKRRWIKDRAEAGQLAYAGIARWNNGEPFPVTDEVLDRIPVDTA